MLALSDPRLSNRDKRLMQTAIKLAEKSDCPQRHGAIVYKSGRILSTGINIYKNTPSDYIAADGISVHAEISALSRVSPENLKGSTVYIARRGRCSVHALSRPCPKCYEALVKVGVKKIVYTD